ncbi:MAG: hypothetical protein EXQ80_02775 [Candidatus Nanopelagicaceae bacterium]|nr:hypothetical protein [Candidatus Nanopelagicaceae bacterium]
MSIEVIAEFRNSGDQFVKIAKSISSEKLHKSPQNEDWSLANIIHHMADSEAHFYIRYLRILTENVPTTEFFDENVYPELLQYEKRDVHASIALIESIRASSVSLFNNFSDEDWQRKGFTSEGKEFVLIALIKKGRSHITEHANQLSATLLAI